MGYLLKSLRRDERSSAKLTELIKQLWDKGSVPKDFKDANAIHLYKDKNDKASRDNHRGISLLSIPGKIMARIILSCITHHLLDDFVSESQCAFIEETEGRST